MKYTNLNVAIATFISIIIAYQSSINYFISLLKTGGYKYLFLFAVFGTITHYFSKITSKLPLLILFTSLVLTLGYFTSFFSIFVVIFYYFLMLSFGFIVCSIKNRNKSLITIFAFSYSFFAFIFNVPFLINSIPLKQYYYFILIFLIIIVFSYRRKVLELKSFFNLDRDFYLDPKILLLLILYLYSASITSFMWDDVNAYLYFPLQSIIENKSILSPLLPGSLTFQSLHSLSFTSALGIWSDNSYKIVYYYKFFNLLSYILAFICLWNILAKVFNNKILSKLTFFIISTSCIWFIEITSNYTDFPIFILTLYCLHIIINTDSDDHINLDYIDYIIFGFFLSVTLKTLVLICPLVIFDLYSSILKRKLNLKFLLIPLPLFPSLIRNYIYSGNPTFPAGNNFWKSEYFLTDPTNIVVSKYWPSGQIDFVILADFLTISGKSLSNFYSSLGNFYSPAFYFLFPFTILLFLFKYINLQSNRFLLLGVMTFFLTIYLPGAQHRYFIPSYCFLLIGFIYLIFDKSNIKLNIYFINTIILLLIFLFPLSPYVSNKVHIKDKALYAKGFRDWYEKIVFYREVNNLFLKINEHPKILLHYIQDKIFLTNSKPVEYDWYDYYSIKGLIDIMASRSQNALYLQTANNFLCINGFRYAILTPDSPLLSLELENVIQGSQQSLYRINCKNL